MKPTIYRVLLVSIIYITACTSMEEVSVVADFYAASTEVDEGANVTFRDNSKGDPISWQWTFEGGNPASSVDSTPSVNYLIPGVYDVTLTVKNSTTEDTKTMSGYITVNCLCSSTCTENCESVFETSTLNIEGVLRTYDTYLPKLNNIVDSQPVIIDLHGFSSTKENQRKHSDFDDIAEQEGVVLVWPQGLVGQTCLGSDNYWNANFDDETNDIGFISALIDQIILKYNVDRKRIYVTGLSNGGFMTYSLACALSDKIAAVASVAGLMTDDLINSCSPTRAMPVLHIHGTADSVVLWEGDDVCEGGIASVDEIVAFWRNQTACSSEVDEIIFPDLDTTDGCTARLISYTGCLTGEQIQLLQIDGGGHNWPGSQNMINIGHSSLLPINNDIDASEIIWDFFKEHSLP